MLVKDIDFASLSQHTLLPFYGRCHIAYVPCSGVVLGLSKLARLTKLCAKQLQTQDSLARHVLHVLQSQLQPKGAVVVVQARHLTYTSAQPPRQRTAAAASGMFADQILAESQTADASLQEVFGLLGVCMDIADVQYLQDSTQLAITASGSLCNCSSNGCSSNGYKPIGSGCLKCGSSRLEPSILRGMSVSAGVGVDQDELALAPITPDPSENDDTDSSEQGSVQDSDCSYRQQGMAGLGFSSSSCRSIGDLSEPDSTNSMEAAMQLLLAEAGVDVTSGAVQSALRQYVLSLLAATSGYLQEQPSRNAGRCSSVQSPHLSVVTTSSCSCCGHQQKQGSACEDVTQHVQQTVQQCEDSYQQYIHHIPFMSQCEHHMLPFHGTVHISYLLPGSCSDGNCPAAAAPLTLHEVEQLVCSYTKRLQVQERITHQVADAVNRLLQPAGVMVVVSAVHMCMVARGVENHAGSTSTRAAFGVYEHDAQLRCRFLRSLQQL